MSWDLKGFGVSMTLETDPNSQKINPVLNHLILLVGLQWSGITSAPRLAACQRPKRKILFGISLRFSNYLHYFSYTTPGHNERYPDIWEDNKTKHLETKRNKRIQISDPLWIQIMGQSEAGLKTIMLNMTDKLSRNIEIVRKW